MVKLWRFLKLYGHFQCPQKQTVKMTRVESTSDSTYPKIRAINNNKYRLDKFLPWEDYLDLKNAEMYSMQFIKLNFK